MRKATWVISGLLGLPGWFGIALGVAQAQEILRVDISASLTPIAGPPTLSLFQGTSNVTGEWLPAPGSSVRIVINGISSPAISLVCPDGSPVPANSACGPFTGSFPTDGAAATATNPFINPATNLATTSAYPGQCTNCGPPTDLSADFTLTLSGGVYQLTAHDYRGMAVLVVDGSHYFIVPQDTNSSGMAINGIPDIYESTHLPPASTSLTANADIDTGPVTGSLIGDGISNFDEYGGFMVSGSHSRTDPRTKDLFVHLVNPQCLPDGTDPLISTASLLGGGTTTFPTALAGGAAALFANVNTLISGTQIRLLSYTPGERHYTTTEWVDKFFRHTVAGTEYKLTPESAATVTPPPEDRQINQNALYPLGVAHPMTGRKMQKGLRIIECAEPLSPTPPTTPLGFAGQGSPNGPDNAIIYTRRTLNDANARVAAGGGKKLKYFTFQNGAWTDQTPSSFSTGSPTPEDINFIISKIIEFIMAMEIGHSIQLTPTVEGTRKTSYGHHHAPQTGSNLDQAITNTVTTKANSFYIPFFYNSGDQASFLLTD